MAQAAARQLPGPLHSAIIVAFDFNGLGAGHTNMADWMDQMLSTFRSFWDSIPWRTAAESAVSPAGLTLIATIVAAFAVGLLLGRSYGRLRQRAVIPAPAAIPNPTPAAPETGEAAPQAALRATLAGQGLPAQEITTRVRAFTAGFGKILETLETLAAGDPESEPLIRSAERSLREGDLEAAATRLDQARGRFSATGRLMAERADRQRLLAVQASELAGDLELARRGYEAAARLFAQALEYLPPPGNEDFLRIATKQATAEFRAGKPGKAAPLLDTVARETARIEGADTPAVAKALNRLAAVRFALGETDAAEDLYRRAHSIDRAALGDAHPAVALDINNLAQLMKRKGDLPAAEPLLRKALEIREKALGPRHPSVRRTARDHAAVLRSLNGAGNAA